MRRDPGTGPFLSRPIFPQLASVLEISICAGEREDEPDADEEDDQGLLADEQECEEEEDKEEDPVLEDANPKWGHASVVSCVRRFR